ncbi:hypothetical protein [Gloeothece verrucosa]|uniref:Uncharacterized protein n=1 Tax=Gloeothece verrucosa (strain PCC 7822) TaxID=497965 RepID=E0UMG3_GLOV7|nr:hypothetical protein [Gloeothece verrucosa]ADN18143.1 hypothetical protein Cyan7822_6354 [Gloeothece verrucosa PCC 7822]
MERQALYEKYKTLNWEQQLGNLALTLSNISKQCLISRQDKLTSMLLREAALMIEWSAPNVPSQYHYSLAAIQKECLKWQRNFPIEEAREILSFNRSHHSETVLMMTNLLDEFEMISIA